MVVTRAGKPEVVMLSIGGYMAMTGRASQAKLDRSRKMRAYEAMEAMKRRSPFPKDFDYEKAREEALTEKYGRFD